MIKIAFCRASLSLTLRGESCADKFFCLKKGQKIGVELFLVRFGQAVGCACIYLQGRVLDQFRGGQTRSADRYNLIVVTVNDQRRHVELVEVFGEIRLGERLDACLLYTSPSPRDGLLSRMPSSA